VRVLLEADASQVNVKDSFQFTPLHWAAAGGHVEGVKQLLWQTEFLPEVDVSSPWHLASWGDHWDVLDVLWLRYPEGCPLIEFKVEEILQRFEGLTTSTENLEATHFNDEIEMCHYYGTTQLRKGRMELASA